MQENDTFKIEHKKSEPQKQEQPQTPKEQPKQEVKAPADVAKKAPIGIKIMASLLLLAGLWIGFIIFTFIVNPFLTMSLPVIIVMAIGAVIFWFTERTAMGLFKLKPNSIRNYYIAIALYALYATDLPGLLVLTMMGIDPGYLLYEIKVSLTASLILFLILALPFFLASRNHKDLYKKT